MSPKLVFEAADRIIKNFGDGREDQLLYDKEIKVVVGESIWNIKEEPMQDFFTRRCEANAATMGKTTTLIKAQLQEACAEEEAHNKLVMEAKEQMDMANHELEQFVIECKDKAEKKKEKGEKLHWWRGDYWAWESSDEEGDESDGPDPVGKDT